MLGGLFGGGFGGGGAFQLGFTLLSGLLQNIGSPKHPDFNKLAAHPGFNTSWQHPGFGSLVGGPNVSTVGAANNYFGTAYTGAQQYQTAGGQYWGNAAYSYPNQGFSYPPYNGTPAYPTFGAHDYRSSMGQPSYFQNPVSYQNWYSGMNLPTSYPPMNPSFGTYGSAPAPYAQGLASILGHYGFGAPQQYNPAATLFGHQSGAFPYNQGVPQYPITYGGPNGQQVTVHQHHYHVDQTGGGHPNNQFAYLDWGNNGVTQTGGRGNDVQFGGGQLGNNNITQYGAGGNDQQTAQGGDGNDNIFQSGGVGHDRQTATGGRGHDNLTAFGGDGNDVIGQQGGVGNDRLRADGGSGNDRINTVGGAGNDNIRQVGGDGNDILRANGGAGKDVIVQEGGKGNDTFVYTVSAGQDRATINGGPGKDKATIQAAPNDVFTVVDANGKKLFSQGQGQGTVITVSGVEDLKITGANGKVLYPKKA